MYIINDRLATHGIPQDYLDMSYNDAVVGDIDGFKIVDVRMLKDEPNPEKDYMLNILRATSWLDAGEKVVICCSAGQSRSNAIAIGVLVKYFNMDFFHAWELVRHKVPICNIDPSHIVKLKKLFGVTLP